MSKTTQKRARIPTGKSLGQFILDKKLHRKFKARCVEAGKTMSQQIEELVRAWVKTRT